MTEAASNANLLEFAKRLLAAFPGPAGPLFAENDPRVNGDKEPSENFNNKPTGRSAEPKENQAFTGRSAIEGGTEDEYHLS